MKDLYLKISDRIRDKAPQILWIDLDTGQLDAGTPPPIEMPAALISIAYPSVDAIDDDTQTVSVDIGVRVVAEVWAGETSAATPAQWRQRSLAVLDLSGAVTAALQGYSGEQFSSITRTSVIPEERGDGLWVCRINFSTSFIEEF